MLRSVTARFGVALAMGAIVLSALAAPVSAAVHTRWVDDDSVNGDGPTACNTAHFHTIQAAINASSAGDQVFVCPGTYAEQLNINVKNLLVQAKPTRTATIVPPEAANLQTVDGGLALVNIMADGASLIGFKMKIPAGDIEPVGALPATCTMLDGAVYSPMNHVSIEANTIKAVGDNSLSGQCGYLVGIALVNDLATGPAYGPDTSDISRNVIRDFKLFGVLVEGGLSAKVYRNSIRFVHQNDPATCVIVPVLGVAPNLTFPCPPVAGVTPKQSNGIFEESAGILVEDALGDLRGNSVYSTFDFATCEFSCTAFLGAGIAMVNELPGSIVRNNRTNNVGYGIVFGAGVPVGAAKPSSLPEAPGGAQVTGNRMNESFVGLAITESNSVFYGNRAHLNFGGVVVEDGAGNVFVDNDFRYNLEGDCIDLTGAGVGPGTLGTNNNWDALNLGVNNEPTDLCLPFGIF